MGVALVQFVVLTKCTAPSGEVFEPGVYHGTSSGRPDINAPNDQRDPVYILKRPPPALPVDVSALVKSGEIIAS